MPGQYQLFCLHIYTSLLCSLIHRLLRCHISYRHTVGLSKLIHILVNIVMGALEVNLLHKLPLESKCAGAGGLLVLLFGYFSVLFGYFSCIYHLLPDRAPLIYPDLFAKINILSYILSSAIIQFQSAWAGIAAFSWSSLFMFAPLFPFLF